jgi:aspartyl protease family protein
MRNIMIFAAVMVVLGTFMAQVADKMASARAGTVPPQAAAVDMAAPATGRTLSIPHDARGHFATEGRINGQRMASWSIPARR